MNSGRDRSLTSLRYAGARMLRVVFRNRSYDWVDLDDLGDVVKRPEFVDTLRENIAHYFGVPVDLQAIYDNDGLLTSVVDFSRTLQGIRPALRVYDLREMTAALKRDTAQRLATINKDVAMSRRTLDPHSHSRGVRFRRSSSKRASLSRTKSAFLQGTHDAAVGDRMSQAAWFGQGHLSTTGAPVFGYGTRSSPRSATPTDSCLSSRLRGSSSDLQSPLPWNPRPGHHGLRMTPSLPALEPLARTQSPQPVPLGLSPFLQLMPLGHPHPSQPVQLGRSYSSQELASRIPWSERQLSPCTGSPCAPFPFLRPSDPSPTYSPSNRAEQSDSVGLTPPRGLTYPLSPHGARSSSPLPQGFSDVQLSVGRVDTSESRRPDVVPSGGALDSTPPATVILPTSDETQEVLDYDIEVTLTKGFPGKGQVERFGFSNVPSRDGSALLVSWIDDHGLLAKWNRKYPQKAVSEGDRIVAVNGVRQDIPVMRQQLQTQRVFLMVLRQGAVKC